MNDRSFTWILLVLLSAALLGCSTPEGRIMGDEEEDYVGTKAAGGAIFDRLIEEAVGKLLNRQSAAGSALGKISVAYLGVENKSIEELVDTSIETSGRYKSISRRFVKEALRESRLNADNLFIPKHRRKFIKTLEAQGNPVEFLLFSKLTSGTTRGDGVTQRAYALTLELVNVETGEQDKETARERKAYTR